MKLLVLFCACAALAAPAVRPPTISLTLVDLNYADRNCANHPCNDKTHAHASPGTNVTAQNEAGKYQSATCEYGASESDCPLPECTAFDHHDMHCVEGAAGDACRAVGAATYCNDPHSTHNGVELSAHKQATRYNSKAGCTHAFQCSNTTSLINIDGATPSAGQKAANTQIDRNLRAEWLITYDAKDESDNQAESVSFAMIFQDTQAPSLETEFCKRALTATHRDDEAHDSIVVTADKTGTGGTKDDCTGAITRKFAQSCTECQADLTNADDFSTENSCCTHALNNAVDTLKSWDDYDQNVTDRITVSLINPQGVVTDCTGGCDVDTQNLGTWSVMYASSDKADMYGTGEMDNEVTQNVTIEVTDDRKPYIFMRDHSESADTCSGNLIDPIIECATGTTYENSGGNYTDAGADCKDLQESWHAASGKWQFESVTAEQADIDAVDVATLNKKATTLKQHTCGGTTKYVNEYDVRYNCQDQAIPTPNDADTVTRTVRVEDTTPPSIWLQTSTGAKEAGDGEIVTSAGYHTHSTNHGFEDYQGWSNSHDSAADCQGHDQTKCKGANHSTGFVNWNKLGVGRTVAARSDSDNDNAMDGHRGGVDKDEWNGAYCTDTCNPNPEMVAELRQGKDCTGDLVTGNFADAGDLRNFPEFTSGWYSIKYTCSDGETGDARPALTNWVCRNIENVDATKPIIQILGSNVMSLEATHAGNYVDDGAVCYDQVDGVISQNIEVSGDVVNLAKVGTYIITYNCRDSAGNVAPTESRTVHVQRTGCPVCSINGCSAPPAACTSDHEASFDYTDAGAACSDTIDGVVDVNTTNPVNVELTGEYVITYRAKNSVGLWNDYAGTDPAAGDGCGVTYTRTINVVDTLKPKIVVKYNDNVVAQSLAADTAVHNTSIVNPANDYMAEVPTTTHNAWVAASALAAIAGVALLATSTRRATMSTAVPV